MLEDDDSNNDLCAPPLKKKAEGITNRKAYLLFVFSFTLRTRGERNKLPDFSKGGLHICDSKETCLPKELDVPLR